jgi:dynein intermediate chain, cytosolic
MASRQDELQAKKARLAELKRQRELRTQDPARWRQSIGTGSASEV